MAVDWRARAAEVPTVPNLISLSRLPLVAGIVALAGSPLRFALFALVVASDGVDGWVARRLDQETELGALLDPALDKLTALALVVGFFPSTGLPVEYLVLFFARDAFVASLAPLVPLYGFDTAKVKARLPGKAVTNLQFLAIVGMLVPHAFAVETLLWATALASVAAVADYVLFVARELTDASWPDTAAGVAGVVAGVVAGFGALVALFLRAELAGFLAAL
ncbi:MAG: CDP-alcohol phosphatidyltransferase family protein [Haloarculaceae archaeon]